MAKRINNCSSDSADEWETLRALMEQEMDEPITEENRYEQISIHTFFKYKSDVEYEKRAAEWDARVEAAEALAKWAEPAWDYSVFPFAFPNNNATLDDLMIECCLDL